MKHYIWVNEICEWLWNIIVSHNSFVTLLKTLMKSLMYLYYIYEFMIFLYIYIYI